MKSIPIRPLSVTRDLRTDDQRGKWAAIEQARADAALEEEWRRRVRRNPKEVASLPRRIQEASR